MSNVRRPKNMKRDLDLIRKLLLAMEAREHAFVQEELSIEDYTEEQIGFHVYLLGEAGLAKVGENTHILSKSPSALPLHLTWAGYEFLEAAKDETLWGKAKEKVIKPAGGVAFGVLVEWLKAEAKAKLGLPL
jgi:hypothetical protein